MHFKHIYRTGREKFHQNFTLLTNQIQSCFYSCYLKALTQGLSLSLLPAIVSGCSESVTTFPELSKEYGHTAYLKSISIDLPSSVKGGTLDILIYNDDKLQRLDSYQRIERFDECEVFPTSTKGQKIIFMQYGAKKAMYEWEEINSYSSLRKVFFDLEDETLANPCLTGCRSCTAGESEIHMDLRPLTSRVILKSISCDFSGTPYPNEVITDAKAYLTNVNASCCIIPGLSQGSRRIINSGLLNHFDIMNFADKSIIVQEISDTIGDSKLYPEACFLCYPNNIDKDRRTRLVIEGSIAGTVYYWPLEVGDNEGIVQGSTYSYDIQIRKKGTSDPDTVMKSEDMEVIFNVQKWTEKENYPVRF